MSDSKPYTRIDFIYLFLLLLFCSRTHINKHQFNHKVLTNRNEKTLNFLVNMKINMSVMNVQCHCNMYPFVYVFLRLSLKKYID